MDRVDVFDSDDDVLDSVFVAGFDSLDDFDDESLADSVLPLVAGVAVVDAESESLLFDALFLA